MYGGASQPGRDSPPTLTACVGPVKLYVSSQSCLARYTGRSEQRGKLKWGGKQRVVDKAQYLAEIPTSITDFIISKKGQPTNVQPASCVLCGLLPRWGEKMHFWMGPSITASQRGDWAITSHQPAMSRLSCCTAPPGHQQGISRVSVKGNRLEWSMDRSLA